MMRVWVRPKDWNREVVDVEKAKGFWWAPQTNVWWMRPFGFLYRREHYLFGMHEVPKEKEKF